MAAAEGPFPRAPFGRSRALGLALLLALAGCATHSEGGTGYYQPGFGTIDLPAGQTRLIRTGITYWLMRVCSDFGNNVPVAVTIDAQPTAVLGPGRCTEDRGNTIQLVNQGKAAAVVTYRTIVEQYPP